MPISAPEYSLLTKIDNLTDKNFNNKKICSNSYIIDYTDINIWDAYDKSFVLEKLPSGSEILECKVDITEAFPSIIDIGSSVDCTIKLSNETSIFAVMMNSTITGKQTNLLTDVLLSNNSLDVIVHFANYLVDSVSCKLNCIDYFDGPASISSGSMKIILVYAYA